MSKQQTGLERFDRHLDACCECRSFGRLFDEARTLLGEPAASEGHSRPSPGFASRVSARLPERPGPLAWASLRLLPVAGALALTLLAWCLMATPSPSEVWSQAGTNDVLVWVSSDDG